MGDSEHTRITNFERLDQWGDLTSLYERRFYLRRLVLTDSNYQIRSAEIEPAGFDQDTSNLFRVNEDALWDLYALQDEVLDRLDLVPNNIEFQSQFWRFLKKGLIRMSREYKIHLQPQEDQIPTVISRLVELILTDEFLAQSIAGFKCRVTFQSQQRVDNRGVVIIYLALKEKRREAREMCQSVLAKLRYGFIQYEDCANGRLPVYNFPITELMSFIQIGTDSKFKLRKILGEARFNRLFPAKFYQALLMDEKIEYYL